MKRFYYFWIFIWGLSLAGTEPARSQGASDFHFSRIETAGYLAWVWPHAPGMDPLKTGVFPMIHLGVSGFPSGLKSWHHNYQSPELGFTFLYADLGYPEVLGHAWGLFPHISIPLVRKNQLSLNLRYGLGAAWLTNYYTEPENELNIAISNPLNILMNTSLELQFPLPGNWIMRAGYGMTHFSNGKTRTPNKGLNIPALKLVLAYEFIPPAPMQQAPMEKRENYSLRVFGATGYTRLYPPGGPAYMEFTLSTTFSRNLSEKVSLGLGADLFWGFSDREVLRRKDQLPASPAGLLKPGLHFSYEQWFGKTAFIIHQGFYLYAANTKDGPGYNRIGFRHHLTEKWLINLSLKSHLFRADYFELGVGYRFI
ncbi:MAG: acyloxyacyl hydrolase [Bacteroides sp.]|jgi:hypothetical protein|nr:acyloxyacyl hydrolase [Bacteroides sp.]